MRRLRKALLWLAAAAVAVPLLLAGLTAWFVYGAGEGVWTATLDTVAGMASGPDFGLETGRFRRDDDGVVRLDSLVLADADGPWLRVEDVAVDWKAGDLLSGALTVDRLAARRVEVLRLPASSAPAEPEPGGGRLLPADFQWPRAPLPVTLGALKIGEVVLPEGVAPVDSRYRIAGSMTDAASAQALKLDIRPLDLDDSHLNADLSADFASRTLKVEADADMPAIRPLADALGVRPADRIRLNLSGGGPFGEAKVNLDLTVQSALDLVGDLDMALDADGGYRARLAATANLLGGALAEPARALGKVVHLDLAVSGPSTEAVTLERFTADSPRLGLKAAGSYDAPDGKLRLNASADIRSGEVLSPWAPEANFETALVTVDLGGSLEDALEASVKADIARPRYDGFAAESVSLTSRATGVPEDLRGHAELTVGRPQAPDAQVADLAGDAPKLAFDYAVRPETVKLSALDLTTAAARASGGATLHLAEGAVDGDLKVDAPDLARSPRLAELLSTGSGRLELRIRGLSERRGTVDGTLKLQGLGWRDKALADAAGETVDLKVEAGPDGDAMAAKISGRTAAGATVDADATLRGEALSGKYALAVPALPPGLVPDAIEGLKDIALNGTVGGTTASPQTEGVLTAADFRAAGRDVGRPELRYTANDLAAAPGFDVRLGFRSGGQSGSVSAAGAFDPAAGRLTLNSYAAALGSARLDGRGALDLASTLFDGDAKLKVGDLSDLSEMAGVDLTGSVDGALRLRPSDGRQDAKLTLTASGAGARDAARVDALSADLDVRDLLGELPLASGRVTLSGVEAGDARLTSAEADLETQKGAAGGQALHAVLTLGRIDAGEASVANATADIVLDRSVKGAPALSGDVLVTDIAAGEARLDQVTADLSGTTERPAAHLVARATAPMESSLDTELAVDLTDPAGPGLAFATLALRTPKGDLAAQKPFALDLHGETVALRGLDLTASFGGNIRGDAIYAPDRIRTDLKIDKLALGPLAALAGVEGVSGAATADIRIDTAEPGDTGRAQVTLADLRMPSEVGDATLRVEAQGDWQDGELAVRTTVGGPFEQPLVLEAHGALPAGTGQALPAPPRDGAVGGSVRWEGNLRQMAALLPEGDNLFAGPARIDVRLDGTWGDPRLQGEATVDGGRFENLVAGTILQNIEMDVRFDDRGVGEFKLSAADQGKGTLKGSGDMVLVGADKHANLELNLDKLQAVRRDEAELQISGTTRVTWDGKAVDVVGRHVLDRVEIQLVAPDLPPDVVAIQLARDEKTEEKPEPSGPPLPINLDIEIESPGQFFVRGRGLDSEWRGKAVITGTADDPKVQSDFNAIRGKLSLLGKDFTLTEGTIGLAGDLTPDFRIVLERETPDLTGQIIVSGRPNKPDIAFTSTPELPEGEVLPQLLFGKGQDSLSPVEAISMAEGIRTLTNGDRGATDRIRDAIGLDVLRFEEGQDPESAGAISAGRYVREGVYVGAKQSVDSESGSVVVEIDLLPNLKVDTEIDHDGSSNTGITWEKRY